MKLLKARMVSIVFNEIKSSTLLPSINPTIKIKLQDFISHSELFIFISEKFSSARMKNTKKINLSIASLQLVEVRDALLELAVMFSNEVKKIVELDDLEGRQARSELVKKSLTDFFELNTQVLDRRMQNDDDRLLRRMDALARLLTLNNKESVCTAVISDGGALWVSLNREKKKPMEETLDTLYKRIVFIRKAINSHNQIEYKALLERVPQLITQAIQPGETNVSREILEKDLAKLIYSNHPEKRLFSNAEEAVFQDLPVIFVYPAIVRKQKTASCLGIQTICYSNGSKGSAFYDLELPSSSGVRLKDLHAEQLLIHLFMFKELFTPDVLLRLGISKLCCRTCHDYLSAIHPKERVIFRGKHDVVYEGTLNLSTGERASAEAGTEFNQRITHSKPSPKMSPLKQLTIFFKHDIKPKQLDFSMTTEGEDLELLTLQPLTFIGNASIFQ